MESQRPKRIRYAAEQGVKLIIALMRESRPCGGREVDFSKTDLGVDFMRLLSHHTSQAHCLLQSLAGLWSF